MKRTGLGGILALLLCLNLVSLEAWGDDLERFLVQIRREAASKPVALRPAQPSLGEKASPVACTESSPQMHPICHAEVSCWGAPPVSCDGYVYCEERPGSCAVLCDDVFDSCPICV